jgi:hypothetical protein
LASDHILNDDIHVTADQKKLWDEKVNMIETRVGRLFSEIANKEQLKPEFANSIEECTDTNKAYVLPDGYIYAYMAHTETEDVLDEGITNQLVNSTDAGGAPYNGGQGWKADTRLNSSGTEYSYTGVECTGFIPVTLGDVIRFKNIKLTANGGGAYSAQEYLTFYDADKNILSSAQLAYLSAFMNADVSVVSYREPSPNFYLRVLDTAELLNWDDTNNKWANCSNMAYFRISAEEITNDSIITINEEIKTTTVTTTEYSWDNTGHAFVTPENVDGKININVDSNIEFVDSIDECVDADKAYVLPDGYVYAYTRAKSDKPTYTNQISLAINADGTDFVGTNGEDGYKAGYRLNSSGTETAMTGMYVTGFVPVKQNDVVRLSGIEWGSTSAQAGSSYLHLYQSDFTRATDGYVRADQSFGISGDEQFDDAGNLVSFTLANASNGGLDLSTVAYMRLSSPSITADSIITVNEPITDNADGETYAWTNTGHTFVPVDYEDRIVVLEEAMETNVESTEDHELRLVALESGINSEIPDYVVQEAEDVIDRVIAAQGNRTFTFAAITDLHYGNGGYTDGVKHACQTMKYIDERIKLDAVAILGDYTDGYPASGLANAIGDFKSINSVLDDLRFAPNLRIQGNHDYYADNSPIIHRFIQAYSEDVVWGDRLGGYFYKDFDAFKLRVICVNTIEMDNASIACSAKQYQWFADSLDLSEKEDVTEWQILVLSHHPLDWWTVDSRPIFGKIISAYENNGSWASVAGDVSCDYSGKDTARLIGNIHGHIHNLLIDNIYLDVGLATKTGVYRISTPEACIGRANNSYVGSIWEESETYEKTVGTAEDTSFCVYCIDLENCTIKAICYGAGYDREINY